MEVCWGQTCMVCRTRLFGVWGVLEEMDSFFVFFIYSQSIY